MCSPFRTKWNQYTRPLLNIAMCYLLNLDIGSVISPLFTAAVMKLGVTWACSATQDFHSSPGRSCFFHSRIAKRTRATLLACSLVRRLSTTSAPACCLEQQRLLACPLVLMK